MRIVEDTVVAKGSAAESDYNSDKLVYAVLAVSGRGVYCGR